MSIILIQEATALPPVLPEDYELESGVDLPEIYVIVGTPARLNGAMMQ